MEDRAARLVQLHEGFIADVLKPVQSETVFAMVSDPFLKRRRLPTGLAYDNQVRSSGTLVRPQPIERIQCAIVTLPWLDRADHQDGWTGPHVIECLGDALASSNGCLLYTSDAADERSSVD